MPTVYFPTDFENSDSDNEQPLKKKPHLIENGSDYWSKVKSVGDELLQLGWGKELADGRKEPDDPSLRNGTILDPKLFNGPGWKCWSAVNMKSSWMKAFRIATRMELINGYEQPDPDNVLLNMVKSILRYTEKAAKKEQHLRPNHFVVQIESRQLDSDIFLHLRNTTDAAIEEFLLEMERVDISNRAKGRPSILDGDLIIDVNALEVRARVKGGKRPRPGAGPIQRRRRLQKRFKLKHNTYAGAFWSDIPLVSKTMCLFQAIVIAAAFAIKKASNFSKFKSRPTTIKNELNKLVRWCEIPKKRKSYDIQEYGDKIQEYYDKHHPGKVKLFAFESISRDNKPFWSSKPAKFEKPVVVYYDDEQRHYDPVHQAGKLFADDAQYCFKCLSPYHGQARHRASCGCKCLQCQRVGPVFPCEPDDGYEKMCSECCKTFTNKSCFDFHLKKRVFKGKNGVKKETSVCTRSKKCLDCGIVYQTRQQSVHKCDEKWCLKCRCYHSKRRNGCYMRYEPKSSKVIRYIVYDFETTPNQVPHKTELRWNHQVNMCVAYVACTKCIDSGKWKKPLDWCEYCGDHREHAWSSFEINEESGWLPDVHFQVDKDDEILPCFVDWLLKFDNDVLHIKPKEKRKNKKTKRKTKRKFNAKVAQMFDDDCVEDDDVELYDDDQMEDDGETLDGASDEGEVQMDLIEEMEAEEHEKIGKKTDSIVYAHCGSRYDHVIVFAEVLKRRGLKINHPIRKGNKLMQLSLKKNGIVTPTIFRDSYNIISIPLDSFVKTFDLNIPGVPGKLYFPHRFNREENYHIELPHLPPLEDYQPTQKTEPAKKALERWYDEHQNDSFCLKKVLAKYCFFDVIILMHGLVKMRELYMETTGIDITRYLTMPSACVNHFLKTLEKKVVDNYGNTKIVRKKVAIVPENGYERRENTSAIATKYLKWLAHKIGWEISHVDNFGEIRVCKGKYAVDGYVERLGHPYGDLAIEIYGCYWHGCPIHYPNDSDTVAYGRTAKSVRERNALREAEIRQECELMTVWECEIHHKLDTDPLKYERELLEQGIKDVDDQVKELEEMQTFIDGQLDTGPLEASDAFFGGRTGAVKVSSLADDAYTIKYKDVVSLYPYINFTTKYPIGHATPEKWGDLYVDWKCPEDMRDPITLKPLEGIIKGFVVPTKHPKWGIPVLPHRVNGRLLFPLCRTCAVEYPKGGVNVEYECPHNTDEERGFVFTLGHKELEMGLEAGYRVKNIYSAYLWKNEDDWSEDLFVEYIRCWMMHKYHASGWPANCVNEELSDEEREANKMKLINDAWTRYGIKLDPTKMIVNPGLRFLAKQALNSLWGRLALRNRLTQTKLSEDFNEICQFLENYTIKITGLEQVGPFYTMINYEAKREATTEHPTSNPIIALWTTSNARCHLLKQLRGVMQDQRRMSHPLFAKHFPNGILRADVQILYMDTDSVIYRYKTELGDPLLDGEHLGEMKDEYPDHTIVEYWCLAPKAYALKLVHNKTGKIEYAIKTRSVTMDFATGKKVNLDRMREMVKEQYNNDNTNNYEEVEVKNNFRAGKAGGITTIPMTKKLGPTVNKGILRHDYHLAPFGWVQCKKCNSQNIPQCICMFPSPPTILM